MRLLLDTHTFIWFVTDSPRISVTVNELIEDENNEKLLVVFYTCVRDEIMGMLLRFLKRVIPLWY